MDKYVLDSCALLAQIYDETGSDTVDSILQKAGLKSIEVHMNKLNLYEVYYDVMRSKGLQSAELLYRLVKMSPIKIVDSISDPVFRKAGLLKVRYKISLADSIALAEAFVADAAILTSDHHEFDVIEANEEIKFLWIR